MIHEIPDDALFTIPETGGIVKRGPTSIYSFINRGELEALKIGKSTRITGKAIKKFIAALPPYKTDAVEG